MEAKQAPLHVPASVSAGDAGLLGRPEQPFLHRCSLRPASATLLDSVLLLFLCAGFFRCGRAALPTDPLLRTAVLGGQLALLGACAALVVCRWSYPASCGRERQRPAVQLHLISLALGLGNFLLHWVLAKSFLPGAGASWPGGAPGLAAHALLLLFVSGAAHLCLFALAWPLRLSVSLAIQLGMLAAAVPSNQALCAAPLLSHPAARQRTALLFQLLGWLGCSSPLPLSPFLSEPDPEVECQALLLWSQLLLGCIAPMLWEAVGASRLFVQHQRQRAQQGMPPERGVHAAAFSALHSLFVDTNSAWFVIWILVAAASDWCSFLYDKVPANAV